MSAAGEKEREREEVIYFGSWRDERLMGRMAVKGRMSFGMHLLCDSLTFSL